MRAYHFTYHDFAPEEDEKALFVGINEHAEKTKAMSPIQPFAIFARTDDGDLLGGAKGQTYYGCLYVDMLWLKVEARKSRLGTKLMQEAERIGRERHCSFATVNTMDWQALPFYQKLGYSIEFVREGYDKDSKMYFLRKPL